MGKPKKKDLPDLSELACKGTEIHLRVTPRAARNAIVRDGSVLRVSVTVVPENGKANEAVQSLLATAMGVARSDLELKRGQTARDKLFVYVGASRS
ncbi:DUF167 domain-containing protein [Aliisedimentitalea scapharcae]|uniref:UPF0235 protein QEZ52_08480 n=1 Tax=Aliisedimentitalea scapharcae TaxID=1524259 RepID=A0ABZ2XY18_9RHOB|nr:DUF167 domain-containing protein [Rhodobacteraceae bacterium M382]